MTRGTVNSVKEVIVREAIPAARAAITVAKRHGGRIAQDWTREYWRERKKNGRSPLGSKKKSK